MGGPDKSVPSLERNPASGCLLQKLTSVFRAMILMARYSTFPKWEQAIWSRASDCWGKTPRRVTDGGPLGLIHSAQVERQSRALIA